MPRYHGPHCRLRSFPTKCRKCGVMVLYWECTHGCRALFEYPVYGRPLKHHCQEIKKKKTVAIITHNEHKIQLMERSTYQCPVCEKIFETDNALMTHIRQLKKTDDFHAHFFGEVLDLINFDKDDEQIYKETEELNTNEEIFNVDNNMEDATKYKTGYKLKEMPSKIIKSRRNLKNPEEN